MRILVRLCLAAVAAWAAWAAAAAAAAAAERPPVVVELFTSQGCSSCPPADAFLGELARRRGVIALSFHVTYWDKLGWKDPLASPEATRRQRAYGRALGLAYVYTPQMVVGGRAHETGSRRGRVERRIARARSGAGATLAVTVKPTGGGGLAATIPAADFEGKAAVWMVLFDREHTTDIRRGENGGRRLSYHNVAREIRRVGTWDGAALTIPLAVDKARREGRAGCVVIVQRDTAGPILGAALHPFDRRR